MSSSAALMSGGLVGVGLSSNTRNVEPMLRCCSAPGMEFFTGRSGKLYLPEICLVMSYCSLILLLAAAASASSAKLSTYLHLSALALLLTSLLSYSPQAFAALVP